VSELPDGLAAALRALSVRPRILVACDFDGVLAPIVPVPMDARPLPSARDALHALAATPGTLIALVSGRPLDQLTAIADPPSSAALIGSHGAQAEPPLGDGGPEEPLDDDTRHLLERLTAEVVRIVDAHPGTVAEHKPTGVVLHTRRADRPEAAAATAAVLEGPATWPGVHVTRGKEVVEFAVTDVTKGTALRQLRSRLDLTRGGVLYLGDDVTDERAFAVLDDDEGDVTVKVGDGETAARHRLPDPAAVAAMLQALVGLRTP
jgi:trehalose-phosphatase